MRTKKKIHMPTLNVQQIIKTQHTVESTEFFLRGTNYLNLNNATLIYSPDGDTVLRN